VSSQPDEIDYWSSLPNGILRVKDALALRARRKIFMEFVRALKPDGSTRVLDVGVTSEEAFSSNNFLETLYEPKAQITATSIEDASHLEKQYPGLRFVRTDGSTLPFADNEFDVAFSSAVIEHVGDRDRQRAFLAELLRVSRTFFVTTPNRWFPLDLHTALPFIHWLPQPLHQRLLRSVRMEFWASTDHLNLLSAAQFLALFPADVNPTLVRFRTAGFASNLLAYGRSRGTDCQSDQF
jgi:SAM-dependent methyltransferase